MFKEEDSKRTVCRKANCNLSVNGCKVRGRVGGVATERIRPRNTKTTVRSRSGLYFFAIPHTAKYIATINTDIFTLLLTHK